MKKWRKEVRTAPSKFGPHHFTSCFMRDLYLHCFDVSDMSELYVLKMTPSRIFPFALDWIFLYLNCTRKNLVNLQFIKKLKHFNRGTTYLNK